MSQPKGLITPAEAQRLNDAYSSRHNLISQDITKRDDNRSSWVSLEDLKAFIEYAENQAKDLGYEMNGIRIYSGAYPTDNGQAGYTTAFLVPTTKGQNGNNSDISKADCLDRMGNGFPPGANYPQ
ncbi:MAG: hypothetical protein HRU50_04230 [Winogradskyella sp.]|uniref:hypothetical protein n=1 Tax=Winogradskyella sp. TaxID=1883156 RepID=UPI0025CED033|nr:hypothetical protein [Winogradskyella sp.]NRB59132.1 hypothetical protein [Winogradskyella sp.]